MADTTLLQVRIDKRVKKEADSLFSALGLDTQTAIRMFLAQALQQNGLPFDVFLHYEPNNESLEALEEARQLINDPNVKTYENFLELLEEVKKEVGAHD